MTIVIEIKLREFFSEFLSIDLNLKWLFKEFEFISFETTICKYY